eukprot:UN06482
MEVWKTHLRLKLIFRELKLKNRIPNYRKAKQNR